MPCQSGSEPGGDRPQGTHQAPQTGEAPVIVMPVQFRPLDRRAVRLEDAAYITIGSEQFARGMDCSVTGAQCTRPRQLPGFSKYDVPHHLGFP